VRQEARREQLTQAEISSAEGGDIDVSNTVMYAYTLEDAINDGVLVKLWEDRWPQLSGGKPIVATSHMMDEFSMAAMLEIWNDYVVWRNYVMPSLPKEEQLFSTPMNNRKVWVIEDGQAFTILFPEDY
jgi:hypothetical protein